MNDFLVDSTVPFFNLDMDGKVGTGVAAKLSNFVSCLFLVSI